MRRGVPLFPVNSSLSVSFSPFQRVPLFPLFPKNPVGRGDSQVRTIPELRMLRKVRKREATPWFKGLFHIVNSVSFSQFLPFQTVIPAQLCPELHYNPVGR